MHLNTDPAAPPRLPCWRDLADLVRDHLPCAVVQLVPLAELERRAHELRHTHPRFREEVPLVLQHETARRARLAGGLRLATTPKTAQYA